MKKAGCLLLILLILGTIVVPVQAAETDAYARKMLQYYQCYQQEAMPEIGHYLSLMEAEAPMEAARWQKIMERWNWVDTQMPIFENVLPDGLTEDSSLCIVVLGYGLESNGAMKPELISRLQVALASARRYPNAWILLTGGETAHKKGVSEAGEMGKWLMDKGIDRSRILLDTASLSTTENAKNSCDILHHYPRVDTLALVTSDYHCRWGASLLAVEAYLEFGEEKQLVCAASCKTDKTNYNSYHAQASGIAHLAGIQWRNDGTPELYIPRATETASVMLEQEETQETSKNRVWPVVGIMTAACAMGAFVIRKK